MTRTDATRGSDPTPFQDFLEEARGVPPAEVTALPTFQRILAAPAPDKRAVVREYAERYEDRYPLTEEYGGFIVIAVDKLIRGIIEQDPLPLSDVEIALIAGRRALFTSDCYAEVLSTALDRDLLDAQIVCAAMEGKQQVAGLQRKIFMRFPMGDMAWADRLREDTAGWTAEEQEGWRSVVELSLATPVPFVDTDDWVETALDYARDHAESAEARLAASAPRWLSGVRAPAALQGEPMAETGLDVAETGNTLLLHGLVAMGAHERWPGIAAALAELVLAATTVVLGAGTYAPRLAHRCMRALAMLEGEGDGAATEALQQLRMHRDVVKLHPE